jgi:hypothetical protein
MQSPSLGASSFLRMIKVTTKQLLRSIGILKKKFSQNVVKRSSKPADNIRRVFLFQT